MVNKEFHLAHVQIPIDDWNIIQQAALLDGRKPTAFLRHYAKSCADNIISNRGQKEVLKAFSNNEFLANMMKELGSLENEAKKKK